jgi:hypothetical protein
MARPGLRTTLFVETLTPRAKLKSLLERVGPGLAELQPKTITAIVPCSPSSSPSPERIDESVPGKSPLEERILLLPEFAIVLE